MRFSGSEKTRVLLAALTVGAGGLVAIPAIAPISLIGSLAVAILMTVALVCTVA